MKIEISSVNIEISCNYSLTAKLVMSLNDNHYTLFESQNLSLKDIKKIEKICENKNSIVLYKDDLKVGNICNLLLAMNCEKVNYLDKTENNTSYYVNAKANETIIGRPYITTLTHSDNSGSST